ncbi:MAG: tetratricopeptide repeat protein [Cyanothece sp. SIO1E1]|nr:tetratricopeptide repeat protein [Cyanothece sp. SIO1E1]
MSSGSSPSSELLKQSTEALNNLLRWIAGLIASKNWSMLLSLAAIAFFLGFKPADALTKPAGFGLQLLSTLGFGAAPDWYPTFFWSVEVGLVISALVIAVRALPKVTPATAEDLTESKAIKGLRPFSTADADIYGRLQRQRSLRECIDSITSRSFRFGILHGESGCGKTSFLQAGVVPRLSDQEAAIKPIYIRFSDQAPLLTIAKALSEQLEVPPDWLVPEDRHQGSFVRLLNQSLEATEQPLVLLFDQFEQFFVHQKRQEDRAPFVTALAEWYRAQEALPVKVIVSIRSDLMYQLDELHRALSYALGPQEIFRLENFTPKEATRILEVIAETENLSFDRRFITELAEQELGNRDDGRISPVDLQILAWMIERQSGEELRAFKRSSFEKFGGVEGLLQRFLQRTLEARVTSGQRQSAMKVLLALTDLDRQVRAGVLTVPELTEKLQATAKPADVAEAVTWLARGDVRLITPQEQNGEIGYELAHERLIPVLMRQSGKELSAADKANQLLDRRVNEWLGNRCSSRYLLQIDELWSITRQQPYLVWGAKQPQKERLLRLSRQRIQRTGVALLLVVLIASSGLSWLWFTPAGQIRQVEWQLVRLLPKANDEDVANAAVAFAKNEQWSQAFRIVKQHIQGDRNTERNPKSLDSGLATFVKQTAGFLPKMASSEQTRSAFTKLIKIVTEDIQDDWQKSGALRAIVTASVELQHSETAAKLLEKSLESAQSIQDDRSKSEALRAIAVTYGELKQPETAAKLIAQALDVAQTIQKDLPKSEVLRAIATASGDLRQPETAAQLLAQALDAAQTIQNDWRKSEALRAIAMAFGELNQPETAAKFLEKAVDAAQTIQGDGPKSESLSAIATAFGELKQPETAAKLLEKALDVAQTIRDDWEKSYALRAIAKAYEELKQPETAAKFLEKALDAAQTIQDGDKSYELRAIATASGKLKQPGTAAKLLAQALDAAQTLQEDQQKSEVLRAIATAIGELKQPETAAKLLEQALDAAQTIEDDLRKSEALSTIATAIGELKQPETAAKLLEQALDAAQTIEDDWSIAQDDWEKSEALRAIATASGKLKQPGTAAKLLEKVLDAAQTFQEDGWKSSALSAIASATKNLNDSTIVQDFLKDLLKVAREENDSFTMGTIAQFYARQGNWSQALYALRRCKEGEKITAIPNSECSVRHRLASQLKGASKNSNSIENGNDVPGLQPLKFTIQAIN